MALYMYGDNHGHLGRMAQALDRASIADSVIVQLGDLGFTHDLIALNAMLAQRNVLMYALRGNHDRPYWFDGTVSMSHLKLVPDYSVLETEGLRILMVGGAVSVDRSYRNANFDYWPDEAPVWDEVKARAAFDSGIDIIASHSAPHSAPPYINKGAGWSEVDATVPLDCIAERGVYQQLFDMAAQYERPRRWYYGHFHDSLSGAMHGRIFRCLGIDEVAPIWQPT